MLPKAPRSPLAPGLAGAGARALGGGAQHDDPCVLAFGDVHCEIDWRVGGRVTAVRLADLELVTDSSVNPTNFGSTFWTSPQSDWNWPPVQAIDNAPYSLLEASAESVRVASALVSDSTELVNGIRVIKTFSANAALSALDIEYRIENVGPSSKCLAPWEITRVAAGGLTFFATSSAPFGAAQPATQAAHGCVWFQHDASVPPDAKLFADGDGWIAHLTPQNFLLIKSFPDVLPGQAAPGEGEIEVYSSPHYVEVENQGAYADIPAGGVSTWNVRWYLRQFPSHLSRKSGSVDLRAFVAQTLS